MVDTSVETDLISVEETSGIIADLREAVLGGEEHWFLSLLSAIRRWPLPAEQLDGRHYRYLIGGEAFDWLLLAERLCDEIQDLLPEDASENLLFHGRFPIQIDEQDFQRLLGAKCRGHLNFAYGVRVEEALQLAVQDEVHKERLSRIWENSHMDDEVFHRIYGATRPALLAEFQKQQPSPVTDEISLTDLKEFTYWLFKLRVRNHDPARVASDTRKGLAQLQRLESLRSRTTVSDNRPG